VRGSCQFRHPKEGLLRPRTVPTPASQLYPLATFGCQWSLSSVHTSTLGSECTQRRFNTAFQHWGSPPKQEGTRVETANVRISLSSCLTTPPHTLFTFIFTTLTFIINTHPHLSIQSTPTNNNISVIHPTHTTPPVIQVLAQTNSTGSCTIGLTNPRPSLSQTTLSISIPQHSRVRRGREGKSSCPTH